MQTVAERMTGLREVECFQLSLTACTVNFFLSVMQRLRSAEMLEMHQRTREAVDSIVQHYQVVACI